jgi:phosphohistidine phosphatase
LKLYVMRHGPAEDHAESGIDGDRSLTASGRERVRAVAKLLLEVDEQPLQIITSPLVRAVQTAEIVALVTKLAEREGTVDVRRQLSPGGNGAALVAAVASAGSRRVMLVGHEPDLSELLSSLLSKGAPHAFDKAMVVGLHVEPSVGSKGPATRLRFVLDPRALKLDPDSRGTT